MARMARGELLRVEWRSDAARDRTRDGPEAVNSFLQATGSGTLAPRERENHDPEWSVEQRGYLALAVEKCSLDTAYSLSGLIRAAQSSARIRRRSAAASRLGPRVPCKAPRTRMRH